MARRQQMVYDMYMRRYAVRPDRVYTWTPDIAYCVGLMASDGCLQKDGRHLDLTSVDHDQLLNFCKAFGRDIYIGTKQSGSETPAYRVQFSDVAFYDFLVKVGLTPAKSHTIAALSIPSQFYPDFLRGLFDGDGTTYGYFDPRWKSSFMFYVSFASASRPFLEYVQQMNDRYAGRVKGTIKSSTRVYSLAYAKTDSLKLAKFMYYQEGVPHLIRKKEKLNRFIKQHEDAILSPDARVVKLVNTQP